jgi:hypothetical protein
LTEDSLSAEIGACSAYPRRASDWETTSVPDIAKHAQQLARAIALR